MILSMLREAFRAMAANRLRTFLTMLGMIIGVGAVILMLAIGQGAQAQVQQAIASMGSNLFIVLSGFTSAGGVRLGTGQAPTLTVADGRAIAELSSIAAVAPVQPGSAQVVYGPNNWATQVYGITPSYLDVRDWHVARGYAFSDNDVRSMARVALLGRTVIREVFSDEDPLNKVIRIKNNPFTVIGVLEAKGQSLDGRDQDDVVLIPLSTAQRKVFGAQFPQSVRFIMVQAISEQAMPRAEKAMDALLRERHRIQPGTDPDFTIRNLSAVAEVQAASTRVMSIMLGAIASVSLVVGGIGIMNIMLVSVTERTREIGIRMAIGARRRDILLQFLLEAVIVSIIGCLIGVLLGVGTAALIASVSGTFVVVTAASLVLAFAVAAGVGVFFGLYPARKAAALKPIDALRFQ
jgi:putative ABC transport system permease protein